MGFMHNEDDEWVKKAGATHSQEIQEDQAEEKDAEEEDLEEVEAVAEDRPEDDIPVPPSPCTPCAPTVVRSMSSGSHETRLALLEASVSDLRHQLFFIHIDLWIGLKEIKSLLESHIAELALSIREARLTHNVYNTNLFIGRTVMWDW
ncbi:hypothetical protein CJ030_MR7G011657 [Morella rubra]|uniref:Uncharacterized protein n=1 Tax=Morella rubra TaxID=262757 RepID=A0A6A1V095_9ROSI|nr:hypothetical protein CJ030_MR7G011657 [Morella rubra]